MQSYPVTVCVYHDNVGVGTGEAFNRAIAMSKDDIIVLLCSDDVFTDPNVISDIVSVFETIPEIGHVSRWYHQFVENDRHPVRAWRGEDVIELANNPSGMAFRREALCCDVKNNWFDPPRRLTNRIFVEVADLVRSVIKDGWAYSILRYDTVAVRIHQSISRTPGYYKKMFTTSPVLEWAKLGWKSKDFTSLIQIKNNFTTKAVLDEIRNFISVDMGNLLHPAFWFFSVVALITPRSILYKIPEIYRATWGRLTTKEVKREK
jgi:GT2 family glycosyltransferase